MTERALDPNRRGFNLVIALSAMVAYANSLSGPFIFDDKDAIPKNTTLHHLWTAWIPPTNTTTTGRPLLNFSLALNYAVSGNAVWSYHVLNLLIHIAAALALYGLARRTLLQVPGQERSAAPVAFVLALLWAVHPLATAAVTYIVQRAESLMALLYLLTLYCFARSAQSGHPGRWRGVCVAACWLGMATKEVMYSAPIVLLLYDRAFVSGDFRTAWTRHKRMYAGMAASWLLLAGLVASTGWTRNGTYGAGLGVTEFGYLLSESRAVVHYIRLVFWPNPLIFDYGSDFVTHPLAVLPYALFDLALAAGTIVALRRRPALGFLGVWFFAILAPTCLILAVRQMLAEQRMYLASVPVLVVAVLALHRVLGKRFLPVSLALAAVLVGLTVRRNFDYRTEMSIWTDTVAKRPGNANGYDSVAGVLKDEGHMPEAAAEEEKALAVRFDFPEAQNNLGLTLYHMGKRSEAEAHLKLAIAQSKTYAAPYYNLGVIYSEEGRLKDADAEFRGLLRVAPDEPNGLYRLGLVETQLGRPAETEADYRAALKTWPAFKTARLALAGLLVKQGRTEEAVEEFTQLVRYEPDLCEGHYDLANAMVQTHRLEDAVAEYRRAIQINPLYAPARGNLGNTLAKLGRYDEAVVQFEALLKIDPKFPGAEQKLAVARQLSASRSPASLGP